ncbi:ABC transporter ATP-binding protein [Lentzea sp. NBRC 105346]|uniref:ABC transporter ATP-binding protein n=1 Tax=Lentzea sp. NBRC 105346 TaxID=3032205 RepID=UPI0024A2FF3B|nr:ABC transporter ATP-binding protein [Lentzea sp. NBRC 105346]GLZ33344.1 ABC transporter ATP-binding protein [Lentzea sp. NBRC 105346]
MNRLLGYCLRHRGDLALAFGAAFVAAVATASLPLVLRHLVDHGVDGWIIGFLAVALVRFGAGYVRRYRSGKLSLAVQQDLRDDVFAALHRLDGERQDDLQTGQVVSRSISDVTLIQTLLNFLPNITGNVLMFLGSVVVMAVLSPALTLVALAVGPALWFIAYRSRRDLFPANWHAQQEAAEVATGVEAAVTGVRVVKGFGQEEREQAGLEERARRLFGSRMRVNRLTARYNPAMQAVPALGQVAVLAFGGLMVARGSLTLGTFLAFTTYLGGFVNPVRQLAMLLTISQQARAGVTRVLEIIDAAPEASSGTVVLPDVPPSLELLDVTFAYPGATPVLSGASLRVQPGESVALVGAAGSGKSTIALLLNRFYDPTSGVVRVGGHDVRALDLDSLRTRIGVVFEDTSLRSDTVRANIAYGRPDASLADVRAAARAACADEFISALPDGYDTVIGEQGLTLSGGQRQRIALARALLYDPQVLILDDATSAIDPRVEAEIHANLVAQRRRTVLVIAHRPSTLALADRVVAVHDGAIVDHDGTLELRARPVLRRAVTSMSAHSAHAFAAAASSPPHAGGGLMASAPPSTEMLSLLENLTPVRDLPDVPVAEARAADPSFGLGRLLRPLRTPLLLGLLLVALDAAAQIALPVLIREGVENGVALAASAALVVVLAAWALSVWQVRVTGRTGERLLYTLRVKTFAQLQRLGLDYYERELGGRIMTRMTTDVDALSAFLQTGVATAFVAVLTVAGVLVAMLVIDPSLALVMLVVLPALVLATVLFRRRSVPAYMEARERISAVNAYLQESVAGLRVTQAFRRSPVNEAEFSLLGNRFVVARLRAQRNIATYFPFVELLGAVASALVLLAGADSVGTLIAFLLLVELFFAPMQQLPQVFDGYQQAVIGLSRLRDLMRTPTSTPSGSLPVGRLRGELVFSDVHFAYTDDREALRGVSLRVRPAETLALVGRTGAGKSTIVKLVARFYDPTSGAVSIDGHDLRSLSLADYRHRLGFVPQEAHLFNGTVRDAIAYGRPDATDSEVAAAVRAVGAGPVVEALGYSQPVGERGRNLSAGQRQLLALARAELVDPDILLLDEATAALDLATEELVARAFDAVTRRRTTLVVAHRLTTAARADRIAVLDGGRVAELGTHAELLLRDGLYARMWDVLSEHGSTGRDVSGTQAAQRVG